MTSLLLVLMMQWNVIQTPQKPVTEKVMSGSGIICLGHYAGWNLRDESYQTHIGYYSVITWRNRGNGDRRHWPADRPPDRSDQEVR